MEATRLFPVLVSQFHQLLLLVDTSFVSFVSASGESSLTPLRLLSRPESLTLDSCRD